jgi:hypothetical protein
MRKCIKVGGLKLPVATRTTYILPLHKECYIIQNKFNRKLPHTITKLNNRETYLLVFPGEGSLLISFKANLSNGNGTSMT